MRLIILGVKERHNNEGYGIVAIGNYGAEFFRKNGYNVVDSYRDIPDEPSFTQV